MGTTCHGIVRTSRTTKVQGPLETPGDTVSGHLEQAQLLIQHCNKKGFVA
jgi:hypothetical protein